MEEAKTAKLQITNLFFKRDITTTKVCKPIMASFFQISFSYLILKGKVADSNPIEEGR